MRGKTLTTIFKPLVLELFKMNRTKLNCRINYTYHFVVFQIEILDTIYGYRS